MRPTTTNLIIFALIALAFIAIGGGIFRLSETSRNRLRTLIRVSARILILVGFFLIGTLFWSHVSGELGPQQVWFRAPSFYLAAAFLSASALWWFRRPLVRRGRDLVGLVGYPVLLIVLVGGWQLLAHSLQQNKSQSLHGALLSARSQVAPEIQYMDADGDMHKLSDFKGKVVLLNFWATTCGPCVQEMPGLSELQRKFKNRGFVLVYLSSEEPKILARFFRDRSIDGINGRLVPELPAPDFYEAGEAWPISFLISRSGIVKDTWLGALPTEWTVKKIEKEL